MPTYPLVEEVRSASARMKEGRYPDLDYGMRNRKAAQVIGRGQRALLLFGQRRC